MEELLPIFLAAVLAFYAGNTDLNKSNNTISSSQLMNNNADFMNNLLNQNIEQTFRYIKIEEYISNYEKEYYSYSLLNAEFVRIHDLAAKPEMSNTGSTTFAHGTTTAIALDTITNNYQLCNEYRTKLIEWQAWYNMNKSNTK